MAAGLLMILMIKGDNADKVIPLTPTCHEWRRAGALRLRTVRLVQQHRFEIKPGKALGKRKSKNFNRG